MNWTSENHGRALGGTTISMSGEGGNGEWSPMTEVLCDRVCINVIIVKRKEMEIAGVAIHLFVYSRY